MKRARIAELKNNLSRYLDHVRAGGSVLVLDRERPVAEIVPLQRTARRLLAGEERLVRLERRGLLRRGGGGDVNWLARRKPPRLRGSVLKDLLTERNAGW